MDGGCSTEDPAGGRLEKLSLDERRGPNAVFCFVFPPSPNQSHDV